MVRLATAAGIAPPVGPASGRRRRQRRERSSQALQLNRPRGKIIYRLVLTLVIVAFTLIFIGPMYFLFTDGLKSTQEAIATPPTLYPHHIYPGTYKAAFDRLDIARLMWNTVYYAFGALVFQLVFDVAAAYSLSALRPLLGNVVLFAMLATLMIPATVLVVPQYVTMVNLPILHLNLIGTPEAIWLPSVANAFNIYLLKRFFDSIPRDYIDAAQVDGASRMRILLQDRAADLPADPGRGLDLRPGRGVEGLPLAAAVRVRVHPDQGDPERRHLAGLRRKRRRT